MKLNNQIKGNKNLGIKQRGIGMLIGPDPETPQKKFPVQNLTQRL
tara:strand:- start:6162 stop:6296 length:135 start_codon:yes stop_codon:yes gene_type:complete